MTWTATIAVWIAVLFGIDWLMHRRCRAMGWEYQMSATGRWMLFPPPRENPYKPMFYPALGVTWLIFGALPTHWLVQRVIDGVSNVRF